MSFYSVTEAARTIRNALKAKGISTSQVSVRSERFAGGSAIDVKIKDASVSYQLVKDIAKDHESIDYDQFGEMLSGANRFVSVEIDDDAVKAVAEAQKDYTDLALLTGMPILFRGVVIEFQAQDGYGESTWLAQIPNGWARCASLQAAFHQILVNS